MGSVWMLVQHADGWPDHVSRDTTNEGRERGTQMGTTYTPMVAMTSERVAAIDRLLKICEQMGEPMDSSRLSQLFYRYDAMNVVRAMLAELEADNAT